MLNDDGNERKDPRSPNSPNHVCICKIGSRVIMMALRVEYVLICGGSANMKLHQGIHIAARVDTMWGRYNIMHHIM